MRVKFDIRVKRGVIKLNKRAVSMMRARPGQVLRVTTDEDGNVLVSSMDDPEGMYMGKLNRMSTSGLSCSNVELSRVLLKGEKTGAFRVGEGVEFDGSWWISVITRKNYANKELTI